MMKKLIILFALSLLALSACQLKKPMVEGPKPLAPPNPAQMQPTSEPNLP